MSRDTLRRLLDAGLRDPRTGEAVRRESREADALIAVGSGTINDLCKYAAALDGKPYAVFGTAPSMNGYTSVNASITLGGIKKSLPSAGASAAAEALHGEQVGVAVLTMADLQEAVLSAGRPRVQASRVEEADFTVRYGREMGRQLWREFLPKRLGEEAAARQAREIRNRYTFLDLAADSGLLERFAPARPRQGGGWGAGWC